MTRSPKHTVQNITDTELNVLNSLWAEEPLSAKEITARLYPSCTESDLGTVHSMLQRLEKKGCVTRDRSSRPHQFSTTVSQSDVAGSQLQDLASRVTGGSLSAFLTHLVEADSVSDDELKEIRRLIDRRTRKAKKGEAS